MGGHFHDTAAGTATPRAYEFAWNDDVIAMNQFAGVLTDATQTVASALDTRAKGTPIVVYNPLNIAREDVVEADGRLARRHQGRRASPVPMARKFRRRCEGDKVLFLAKAPVGGLRRLRRGAGRGAMPSRSK